MNLRHSSSAFLERWVPTVLRENHVFHVSLWILLICAAVITVLLFLIHGSVTRILDLQQGGVANGGVLSRRYEHLLNDLRETGETRARLLQLRSSRATFVSFVQRLEGRAAQGGVRIALNAIPSEQDSFGQPYASPVVRYSVVLEGSLESIVSYLEFLYANAPLVHVEAAEFTSSTDNLAANAVATLQLAVAAHPEK